MMKMMVPDATAKSMHVHTREAFIVEPHPRLLECFER